MKTFSCCFFKAYEEGRAVVGKRKEPLLPSASQKKSHFVVVVIVQHHDEVMVLDLNLTSV